MSEPEKQARPSGLDETTDADLPQEAGIPGDKAEDEQPESAEPVGGEAFPGTDDEESRNRSADADLSFAPGSMPPNQTEPA